MSDLKLVSSQQPTPFEQHLLDAVTNESPSAEQRARVRLALGLDAVVPAPPTVAPVARRGLLLKAAAGLIVTSAAVVAMLFAFGHKWSPSAQPAAVDVTQQTPVAQLTVAPSPAPLAAPEAAVPSAAPSTPDARDEVARSKRANKPAIVDSGADLSEQLRLIDAARSAVAAGNAAAASAALSSYRTRFARGPFGQEAAVLQIETLDLQGNHVQAAAQARSFLLRHPNSPHVSVVKRIAER